MHSNDPEREVNDEGAPTARAAEAGAALAAWKREFPQLRDWARASLAPSPAAGEAELRDMEARKDAAYLERNQVVAALAKCFPSGVARTAIEGWSEDWHGCVYIDLPTGQASWHFHDSQAYLFADLPPYAGTWDGHDTPEKYRRLAALAAPPAPSQPVPATDPAPHAMQLLTTALKDDPDYAWSWHCNLAMPIMDGARVSHRVANETAARLMQHLFGIDTAKHLNYRVDAAPSQPAPAQATERAEKHLLCHRCSRNWWAAPTGECPFCGNDVVEDLSPEAEPTPAQAVPLTEEQIKTAIVPIAADNPTIYLALCYESGPYSITELRSQAVFSLARAIERALGITGEPKHG